MATSVELNKIEQFVNEYIEKSPELFLVEAKIAPGNKVTVLVDSDKGITIENCTQINKALHRFIDESKVFGNNNFSLEVSSFGVGTPLRLLRQYQKNIGRSLEVVQNDGSRTEGILMAADKDSLTLEEKSGKGNKATKKLITIMFDQVKHASVLITF